MRNRGVRLQAAFFYGLWQPNPSKNRPCPRHSSAFRRGVFVQPPRAIVARPSSPEGAMTESMMGRTDFERDLR